MRIDPRRKRHIGKGLHVRIRRDVAGLSFDVADAAHLPFGDASFDACRIDRVLQHIADPARALAKMIRVLRPGGVLVAFDSDWETLLVDSGDHALTRIILNAWCDRFPSGWIGRRLVPLFLEGDSSLRTPGFWRTELGPAKAKPKLKGKRRSSDTWAY
jgi:ubiquinone/menaquinone biosynthesis C-methylase UbiE